MCPVPRPMKILEISSFSLDSRKLLALTFLELSVQTVFLRLRFLMARLENAALTGAVVCKARWGAKGKIPKGNIQQPRRPEDRCYDSKRWLTLACSLPAWSSRPGVGGWEGTAQQAEGTAQQAQGRATSLTSGNSGGYSSSYWTPAITFVALNLWLICVKWQSRSTGNSLGISGWCRVESWLSHWTVRTFWTNCLTSLLLFSFAFFHLQMKIPIS